MKVELVQARALIQKLEDDKSILEDSLVAGKVQKEIFYDETDKIQDDQQQKIIKLKSMLLFREQVIRFWIYFDIQGAIESNDFYSYHN